MNILMKIIPALFMFLLPATAQARFYTFENLPAKPLNFNRANAAALRLEVVNGGGDHCSAVSVSPDGYVLTNLHCVKQCLVDNGFAKNGFEETKDRQGAAKQAGAVFKLTCGHRHKFFAVGAGNNFRVVRRSRNRDRKGAERR